MVEIASNIIFIQVFGKLAQNLPIIFTMMKGLKTKIIRSRIEARQLIKSIKEFSNLSQNKVVHHIDHNPLNNDLNNLAPMSRRDHNIVHPRFVTEKPRSRITILETYKELEKALILYNFNL